MALQTVRGFKDILAPDSERIGAFEALSRRVLRSYGYREIRLPTVEARELFVKSTGETTDIVEKEMYVFSDAGGRELALRPEGTPSAVRAYIEHHLHQQGGRTKLYYVGNMFRAERPQAGRFREFEQIGVECFGNPHPAADAEALFALADIFDRVGLRGRYTVHLNTLGCDKEGCRPAFRNSLLAFLEGMRDQLCANCQRRLGRNPLRALDCKADAPKLQAHSHRPLLSPCPECSEHFHSLETLLRQRSAPLDVRVDPALVRGLDYYNRTVFELRSGAVGSQDAIAGGGRYDGLVASMGGPETPAVGWAFGVERTLMAVAAAGGLQESSRPKVYVAVQSKLPELETAAMGLLSRLRCGDAEWDAEGGLFAHSLKAQLKEADRLGTDAAVIFGEEEFRRNRCLIKDMRAKDAQIESEISQVPAKLKALLGRR